MKKSNMKRDCLTPPPTTPLGNLSVIVLLVSLLILFSKGANGQTGLFNGKFFISDIQTIAAGTNFQIGGYFDATANVDKIEVGDMIADNTGKLYQIQEVVSRDLSTRYILTKTVFLKNTTSSWPTGDNWGVLFRPTALNGFPLAPYDPSNVPMQLAIQNAAINAIDKRVAGFSIGPSTERPGSPLPGQVFYDNSTGDLYIYNGTQWVSLRQNLEEVLLKGSSAGGSGISNLADPISAQDAATKKYVDSRSIPGGSSFPSPATAGEQFYHLTERKLYVYTGTDWVALNSLEDAKLLVGNANNIAAEVTLSGDATLDNTGMLTLGAKVVTEAKIADNAITVAKLKADPGNSSMIYATDEDGVPQMMPKNSFRTSVPSGTSLPVGSTFQKGDTFYHETERELYVFDGVSWIRVKSLPEGELYVGNVDGLAVPTAKISIPLSGFGAATADVDLGNQRVTQLAQPVDDLDAANKAYVDGNSIPADSALPASGVAGQQFYNKTDKKIYIHNGTGWVALGTSGGSASTPAGPALPSDGSSNDGDIFYNTTDSDLYVFHSGSWIPVKKLPPGSLYVGSSTGVAEAVTKNSIPLSGFGAATAEVDLGNQRVTQLAQPVDDSDAANKAYVDGNSVPADSALPASGVAGQQFYNKTDKKIYIHNGTGWMALGTSGGSASTPAGPALPSDGSSNDGDIFYNTTDSDLYVFHSGSWIPVKKLPAGSLYVGSSTGVAEAVTKNSIPLSGFGAAVADVSMGDAASQTYFKITNLGDPVSDQDAATRKYVDGSTLQSGITLPVSGTAGEQFLRTTDRKIFVYNGTQWIPLSRLGSGKIYLGSADNVVSEVTMTGDVTLDNTGKATITDASVTVAKLVTAGSADADKVYVTDYTGKPTLVAQTTIGGRTPSGGTSERPDPADPASQLAPGDTFYDTDLKIFYVFNGTTWEPVKDNLGDHTATQNIKLGTSSVSNDGAAGKGLTFDIAGNAAFGQDVTVNGNFYTPSDRRLKTRIETLSNVLEAINQMRGVKFEYKDQKRYASGPKIGVIAQELQKVYPEMVTKGSNGFLKVDYTQLSAVLIEAVKAQQKQITFLNDRLDSQQKQIDEIMKRLSAN